MRQQQPSASTGPVRTPPTTVAITRTSPMVRESVSTRSPISSASNRIYVNQSESASVAPSHAARDSTMPQAPAFSQICPTSKSVKAPAAANRSASAISALAGSIPAPENSVRTLAPASVGTPGHSDSPPVAPTLPAAHVPSGKHREATPNSIPKLSAELNPKVFSNAEAAVTAPVNDVTGNSSSTQTMSQSPQDGDQIEPKPSNVVPTTAPQSQPKNTSMSRDGSSSSQSQDLEVKAKNVGGTNTTPSPGSTNRDTAIVRPPQPHFTVPLDDDPIRRYLDTRPKDATLAMENPSELSEWCEMAWHRIPLNIQQAFDSFEMVRLPRADITSCLFTLNLKSHTILRVDIQRKILAIKLVQRQISLLAVVECKNDVDKENPALATEQHWLIRSLPPTSVWRSPSFRRDASQDDIPWTSGDVPEFDDEGNVIPGKPVLLLPEKLPIREERPSRTKFRPKFGRSQMSRRKRELSGSVSAPNGSTPSRVLTPAFNTPSSSPKPVADASPGKNRIDAKTKRESGSQTMRKAQAQQVIGKDSSIKTIGLSTESFDDSEYCRLLHVLCDDRMNRALDAISRPVVDYDPWEEDIAPLFNDRQFTPAPIRRYSGGVRSSDIAGLTPQYVRRLRSSTMLAAKFSEFKQMYASAARNYLRCEKDKVSFADFSLGRPFVSYAFCLLEIYHDLEPLILRMNTREEGPPPKKRRISEEIISGKSTDIRRSPRPSAAIGKKPQDANGTSAEVATSDGSDHRISKLHSTIAKNDRLEFETEEARVRMVTAILVAIREARAFAAEAKTPEDRTMCDTVLQQLHAQLSQQVKLKPKSSTKP